MDNVIKGTVTVLDEPTLRQSFMFNPNKITDTQQASWVKTQVPHLSHPVYQYGVGGERQIAFELYHCGDRYYAQSGTANGRAPGAPANYDIAPWLRFWRSLLYPAGSTLNLSTTNGNKTSGGSTFVTVKAPCKVIFDFGPFWNNVLCVVTKADITATTFSSKLDLVRAEVAITLEECPDVLPVYASDVRGNPSTLL